jgi:mannose-6-phosphate isomerase-like protein (cupin superfamily)
MNSVKTGYVGSIENATLRNKYFRQVLFTGPHMQLVVMCIEPSQDIDREQHADVDQFFRIEQGEAEVVFNDTEHHTVRGGDAIVVPAGTWHNVINTSSTFPLKLYTLYAPPNHADGAVHRTRADAEAAERQTP